MIRFISAQPPRKSKKLSHVVPLIFAVLVACGGGEPRAARSSGLSRQPISVRGWIADVERPEGDTGLRTVDTEGVRRAELFGATTVWVEDAPYVSGGVAENGSFILLDVPPGNVTITFTAPGVESAALKLENVPGNADVLIPAIVLKRSGAIPADPKSVKVRLPAKIDAPRPTGKSVLVAGKPIPVIETPLAQLVDRRDFPVRPGFVPLATVR
jgi:hypothetical protein